MARERTSMRFSERTQDIDDRIKETKAREFLKVEYKVKNFIETTLGTEIKGNMSEAARNGITVEFLNALVPPPVKYNKNPKNTFHFIENVSFFNQICLDQSKFGNLFNLVDVVDTANATKSVSMVQVLNNLYRAIKYCQAQKSSEVKDFVSDEDIPEEAFEKSQIDRAAEIIKEIEIERKTNTHVAASLLAGLEEEAELKSKKQEEEDAEVQRLAEEAEARKRQEEEEAEARKKQEEEEAEAKRKQDEEDAEAKRKQEEEEAEAKRKQDEEDAEAKRKQEEEDAEAKRKQDEEDAEAKRKQEEEDAETKRKQEEEEANKQKEKGLKTADDVKPKENEEKENKDYSQCYKLILLILVIILIIKILFSGGKDKGK